MPEPVIRNVSDTAFMVAAWRAIESERSDALFRDPLAAKLAGGRGEKIVSSIRRWPFGPWSVALRTVIIDDFIQTAVALGADTVLNLGAGLDTRPYRMALPSNLRWIEVDYPPVVELKESQLASEHSRCVLERVKMDLADLPSRRTLFAEVDGRSRFVVVLTEGVIPYLSVEAVACLADDLRRMKSARSWIVDYFSPQTARYRKGRVPHLKNAPIQFAPKDWFGFFEQHGWRPKETRYLVEEGDRLGRPVPLPPLRLLWVRLRARTLSPERRAALKRSLGYFTLEPIPI
jgi:methyltransferase (TIGR00027 family)